MFHLVPINDMCKLEVYVGNNFLISKILNTYHYLKPVFRILYNHLEFPTLKQKSKKLFLNKQTLI